jgi:hypothetical protein
MSSLHREQRRSSKKVRGSFGLVLATLADPALKLGSVLHDRFLGVLGVPGSATEAHMSERTVEWLVAGSPLRTILGVRDHRFSP